MDMYYKRTKCDPNGLRIAIFSNTLQKKHYKKHYKKFLKHYKKQGKAPKTLLCDTFKLH